MFVIFYNTKKILAKQQKKLIFDLFLGDFQKILIKQHISRSFAVFEDHKNLILSS